MDMTGTFRKEIREFEGGGLGWINGIEKNKDLDGGRQEVVVNCCFEGLEGRMGLNSEGVYSKGRKKEE